MCTQNYRKLLQPICESQEILHLGKLTHYTVLIVFIKISCMTFMVRKIISNIPYALRLEILIK